MRPDTNDAAGIGDYFGLLFANESWPHHLSHAGIASQLRIEAGMRDDNRPGRHLECSFCGLHISVGKIDERAQAYCVP